MDKTISVTELVRHFSEYINRVAYQGESFVLTRGKKTVAELRPRPRGRKLGELPDILAKLPRLSEEEARAFGEDIDAARSELDAQESVSPWEP